MSDRVLIPLAGIGTLELTREAYEAALRPTAATQVVPTAAPAAVGPAPTTELVNAKVLAARLSLPISCVYMSTPAPVVSLASALVDTCDSTTLRCCRPCRVSSYGTDGRA
jgi:hypothetical protein